MVFRIESNPNSKHSTIVIYTFAAETDLDILKCVMKRYFEEVEKSQRNTPLQYQFDDCADLEEFMDLADSENFKITRVI